MTEMNVVEVIGALLVAALGGGFVGRLFDRKWTRQDKQEKESVAEKELQMKAAAAIRDELRENEANLRAELRRVETEEAAYRTRYFETLGTKQALETELRTMQPKYIDLIQQNQRLIAEVETLKFRAGRRLSDQNTETLYRIEQAGVLAAEKAGRVADELEASQGRADQVAGEPGEAADAASRSEE